MKVDTAVMEGSSEGQGEEDDKDKVEGAEAARYELDAPRWALEPARRSCDRCDEADEAPVGRRRLGVARRTAAAEASLEDESLEIGGRDLNLSDVAFIIFCKSSSVPE